MSFKQKWSSYKNWRSKGGNLSSSWMSQREDAGPSASVSQHLLHHLQHFADSNGFTYNQQTFHLSIT